MKIFAAASWRAFIRYVGTLLVVAPAYFVFAKLGLTLASVNPSASPIWAPTGIALAAVLLGGLRVWPAILIGAFAANATTAGTLETSAVIAAGNTLEAVVGGFLIGRWSGGANTFTTPAQVAKFALVCVGPATIISASIGVTTLYLAGFAAWAKFAPIWVTWWLGDAAGALVVTPAIVLWAQSRRADFARGELVSSAAVLALPPRSASSPSARCCRARPIRARSASSPSCRWYGRRCGAARAIPRP